MSGRLYTCVMNWLAPPETPLPRPDEIHIWRFYLDQPAAYRQQVRPFLAADEEARAVRFVFEAHRHAFVVARGALRRILGLYLDCHPAEVAFTYNKHGKPALVPAQNLADLQFNLSHSGRIALLAVTQQHPLGVDVEQWRPDVANDEMAKFTFSEREYQTWLALPMVQQAAGFYSCWTRKEAFIKAHGLGLALDLKTFDIELHPNKPAQLHAFRTNPAEVGQWQLQDIPIDEGYSAAVAVKAHGWQLHLWDYDVV